MMCDKQAAPSSPSHSDAFSMASDKYDFVLLDGVDSSSPTIPSVGLSPAPTIASFPQSAFGSLSNTTAGITGPMDPNTSSDGTASLVYDTSMGKPRSSTQEDSNAALSEPDKKSAHSTGVSPAMISNAQEELRLIADSGNFLFCEEVLAKVRFEEDLFRLQASQRRLEKVEQDLQPIQPDASRIKAFFDEHGLESTYRDVVCRCRRAFMATPSYKKVSSIVAHHRAARSAAKFHPVSAYNGDFDKHMTPHQR